MKTTQKHADYICCSKCLGTGRIRRVDSENFWLGLAVAITVLFGVIMTFYK